MDADELAVLDEPVLERFAGVRGPAVQAWDLSSTAMARLNRSMRLRTHMSKGVVVVPSST
nr:hypothetical protein [Miltoncostaea marina]